MADTAADCSGTDKLSGESQTQTAHTTKSAEDIEKEQEAMLMSKYPGLGGHGKSKMAHRSLSGKGPKYFDSGDYAMALAKGGVVARPPADSTSTGYVVLPATPAEGSTASPQPTPLLPPSSIAAAPVSLLAAGDRVTSQRRGMLQAQHSVTGDVIPTPENIPHRKASLQPIKRQATIS